MCFKHGPHASDSVYELVDELWRGKTLSTDIISEVVLAFVASALQ